MYTALALGESPTGPRRGLCWLVPREYGAWTMLVTGYLTALAVADAVTAAALALVPAMVFLLMAKQPLERLLRADGRRRPLILAVLVVELSLSAIAGLAAEQLSGAALLLWLPVLALPFYAGAVYLGLRSARWRTLRELVATCGLCLVVPGTWVALGLPPDMAMWIVYFGCVLHFLWGVGFIRLQIVAGETQIDAAEVRRGALLLGGSAAVIALLTVLLSLFGELPIWAAVPLLPQLGRADIWLRGSRPWLDRRSMALQEVVLAASLLILFALVAHA